MDDDILSPEPHTPEEECAKLVRQMARSERFTLLFAVCNRADLREEMIAAIRTAFGERRVQEVPIREPIDSLLWYLRDTVTAPKPDALFVYGMENWVSQNPSPDAERFLSTLNAQRNSLAADVDIPLVFWVPEYLLVAISQAAPDFFSVRSGIYLFVRDSAERGGILESLSVSGLTDALGLMPDERTARIQELTKLLAEYQSLPKEQHDAAAELRLMDQLATNYYAAGEYTKAEPLLLQLLAIREQVLGLMHPDTATSLNNLASLYKMQGKLTDAEPLYQQALAIREKVLAPMHPNTAGVLSNLAALYRDQGRLTVAEPLYERALAINEQALGPIHSQTANVLNNLALLYELQGRLTEAEPLHERALRIYEQVLGPMHPDTATSLNNLAYLYQLKGWLVVAEPLYERALAITEKQLGTMHPATAGTLNDLAGLYRAQGRLTEAEPLLARAVDIMENALGESHPNTVIMRGNLEMLKHEMQVSGG